MSSVKSQGSSSLKGKAIASDSLAVPDVGEEMEHPNSEQSTEEETQRDPNSECAPLIDPWYEVHPHFPKAPGDYAPPSPGRVWLALVRRNPDVSWAPLAFSILDLAIRQGTSLPIPLHFKFGIDTASGWREWVDSKLSDAGFMGLL